MACTESIIAFDMKCSVTAQTSSAVPNPLMLMYVHLPCPLETEHAHGALPTPLNLPSCRLRTGPRSAESSRKRAGRKKSTCNSKSVREKTVHTQILRLRESCGRLRASCARLRESCAHPFPTHWPKTQKRACNPKNVRDEFASYIARYISTATPCHS